MTLEEAFDTLKKRNDDEAWQVFYTKASQPLLAYVSALLVTFHLDAGETTQDIVHDVMLAFLKKWPKLKKELDTAGSTIAYMKTSCRNLLVDRYRHGRSAEALLTFLSSRYSKSFGSNADTLRPILLEQIIGLLQTDCASLLRTYISQDLTPAEIAEKQGHSAAALYSRWYRCLQKARDAMMHNPKAFKGL